MTTSFPFIFRLMVFIRLYIQPATTNDDDDRKNEDEEKKWNVFG